MGAPTSYWKHPWDDNVTNDEQWPYQVTYENTNLLGEFGDYPDDYARRDTTVYIDAELEYSGSYYTSTRVQYDMAAVSQALGLSTAQMKAVGRTASSNPRFVGIYPGHLVRGRTYTIRQAIQYTKDGKQYTATMVVNLKVK